MAERETNTGKLYIVGITSNVKRVALYVHKKPSFLKCVTIKGENYATRSVDVLVDDVM